MPIIPDLTGTQGQWKQAAPDTQTAAAPGLALVAAARGLSDAGDQLGALGLKLKAVRDHDALNQARLAFAEAQANHAAFRAGNPDQETWEGNLSAELATARQKTNGLQISPAARKSLDIEWQGWHQGALADTRVAAIQHGVTRARQNITNLDERYRLAGDYDSSENLYREGVKTGLFTPEEAEARSIELAQARKTYQERAAEQAELDEIAADPLGMRKRLMETPPPPDADNATKAKHFRALAQADRMGAVEENRFTDTIINGMISADGTAPLIGSPAEIQRLGSEAGVQPQIIERLKAVWEERHDAGMVAKIADPKYQMAILSDLEAVLEGAQPGQSVVYSEAARLLGNLQPGPAKTHYTAEVKRKFFPDEPAPESDWILQYGLDGINQIEKDGVFGMVPKAQSVDVSAKIADGFLRDTAKLATLGFTADQLKERAALVAEAVAAKKAAMAQDKPKPGPLTERKELLKAENEAARAWLQSAWVKRMYDMTASREDYAIAAAIQAGAATADFTDPETANKASAALWDIRAKAGRVREEIIRWRKRNPKADDAAIRAEILRLAGGKADEAWDELPEAGDGPMVLPPRDDLPADPIIDLPPP